MSTFAKQTSLPGRILLTSLLLVEMMVTMVTVGPGFGQSKKKPEKDDTIRLESDLVTLDAIVTDKDAITFETLRPKTLPSTRTERSGSSIFLALTRRRN